MDLDDSILQAVDVVIVSVHNAFQRSAEEQTARIIRAIEHPQVNILAHPTGRLLPRRDPYAMDLGKIIDAAIANGVALELNCQPSRLDLSWSHWRQARDRGAVCSLNPDAHTLEDFRYIGTWNEPDTICFVEGGAFYKWANDGQNPSGRKILAKNHE